jgi:hypothetical protein
VLPLLLLSASKRLSRILTRPLLLLLLLLPSVLLSGLLTVDGAPNGRMTTGLGPLGGPGHKEAQACVRLNVCDRQNTKSLT